MRRLLPALLFLAASTGFSKEIYFPIAGSVSNLGVFKTDVRIFNPSNTTDITVQAFLLPVGNHDNSAAAAHNVTVPKRQMLVLNDVVTQFGGTDLAAIRLTSTDDFVATERVYVQQSATSSCNIAGTLGQDVPAIDATTTANKQGVLLQLRTTTAFRTNIGAVNPGTVAANVTFKLYDKNNALVSTGTAITMPPKGVIAPTNMTSGFFFSPGSADLSDAWVGYTSDQPVITYASVVDNATLDPTFIAMAADSGSSTTSTPSTHTFSVTTRSFAIDISPDPAGVVKSGDTVVLNIIGRDTTHGLEFDTPAGQQIFNVASIAPGQSIQKTFVATSEGTYNYFCTRPTCGGGHGSMFGQMVVGQPSDTTRPGY